MHCYLISLEYNNEMKFNNSSYSKFYEAWKVVLLSTLIRPSIGRSTWLGRLLQKGPQQGLEMLQKEPQDGFEIIYKIKID